MKEQLVSFKIAKLAKEKGFPQNGITYEYSEMEGHWYQDHHTGNEDYFEYVAPRAIKVYFDRPNPHEKSICVAPSQSLLQKWLREKCSIHITIFSSSQVSWMYRITKPHQQLKDGLYGEDFTTYEEALEVGLQKALKLIKDKES